MNKLIVILVTLLLTSSLLSGQGLSSLSGAVSDPTGAVIPGVQLSLENLNTGSKRQATSDASGNYVFAQVQPGPYKLTGRAAGFSEVIVNAIQLQVNSPSTVNVQFEKVGTVAETISISAESVQVNSSDASLGNAIGTRPIIELPLFARNPASLLGFQPGVTNFGSGNISYIGANPTTGSGFQNDDRNGAVNGGKSDQSNITLDGVDVNDQQTRRAFKSVLRVTLDSVQEFRTTTANANAEQGRTSGAQIALVTRSGTNEIHGALYEFHRNTVTSANDYFNNSSGVKRPALLINVFGGRVGGPIMKNRAFYFFNYEGRRDASALSVSRTVPSALMRQGIIQYQRTDGSIAQLSQADLRTRVDPSGIGASPASLALLQSFPLPNDNSQGDGYNILGYRFTAGQRSKTDTYITRLDYTLDSASKHQLFFRGNLQNDRAGGIPQFPGEPPNSVGLDNSKGFAIGVTSLLKSNFISTFRYGFTRQGSESTGIQAASAATFRNLSNRFGTSRGLTRIVPVHNITQDFALTLNKHDLRFGGTLRFISNQSTNFGNAFNAASSNSSWLRGTGSDLQAGVPDLNSRFRVAYNDATMAVLGILSQGTAQYNYLVDGTVLPTGAPVRRNFKAEEYEWYAQDTWKVSRALTITYGVRHSLMPPVYEANGQQTSADISLGTWFDNRGGISQQGKSQADAGLISYVLANSPQGRPLYPFHKKNLAPRFAVAYSPQGSDGLSKLLFGGPGKTSIRAGFGMFYDLFGQGIIRAFDATAFGLSTALTNPSSSFTSITAPRFTGFYNVPSALIRPPGALSFPLQHPTSGAGSFAITNTIDDTIRPPYNMNLNFSIQREMKGGFVFQASYVGRLSRRSLVSRDLAMPTDLKDPASGVTYFEAAAQMARLSRSNAGVGNVPRIPYWENLWPALATGGLTASQNVYNIFRDYPNDETGALFDLDTPGGVQCSRLGCNALFSSQFSALGALSSVGVGNYHALQLTLRKQYSNGLLFDFNYSLGKSIDLSSNSENAQGPNGPSTIGFAGFLVNPWSPRQRKGVSDFDVTHIFNGYSVWELPFGRGKKFGSDMHPALNAIAGGWQISPTFNASSGLPISVGNGRNWPTNWNITGWATQTGPVTTSTGSTKNAPAVSGSPGPNVFANPSQALSAYSNTLPGQTGQRNGIRGDGAFLINLGVSKKWVMPYKESHSIQLRWETFNLTNTARFDVSSLTLDLGNTASFGKYSATLGEPRQMQFALRYDF
ncbi:MAG: carboxypeptidase regulatory-like domain-containing protein [Bryobacteraceae bacterium]|nr:carboxypeptidase regulatory-like domain-containing protein [Bryobacteraceae bacterium]